MTLRSPVLPTVRRRRIGWTTWFGLAIAVLGWAVLLATLLISEGTLRAGNLVAVLSLRSDIVTIAQTAIGSGFALAVFGALNSGFRALTTFFDAVLQRSAAPRTVPAPPIPEPVVMPSEPPPPMPMPSRPPRPFREPVFPDKARERNYVVRPDGSVEVETMFGTRLFATLDEARDFIR